MAAAVLMLWFAGMNTKGADQVSFARDVAPILVHKCTTCHNREKRKGGYEVETFEAFLRAGESKEAPVVAGDPHKSKVFQLLTAKDEDDRMPQKSEPLPPGQIELIERWIRGGAVFDGGQSNLPLHALISSAHPDPPEAYPHAVPIRALAFNADGAEIAVGGYHEITFWRCEDGKLQRRIKNIAQQVLGIAYAPNGRLLAVASGTPGKIGQLNLVDPAENTAGKVLGTARDAMLAVCFNPAGDRLAAGAADNSIRVYAVESGEQELLIEQHADWVLGLSFNSDGSLLASASRDKTARLFDAKNGELENTYVGHNDAVFAVVFDPEGKRVLSAGRDKSLHVWDVKEAKKLEEVKGFDDEVFRLVVSSNSVFSCGADKKVRQHSLAKKPELVRTFSGHEDVVYAIAYHEASGRLASGSFDGEVRIWDVSDGKVVRSFVAAPGMSAVRSARAN